MPKLTAAVAALSYAVVPGRSAGCYAKERDIDKLEISDRTITLLDLISTRHNYDYKNSRIEINTQRTDFEGRLCRRPSGKMAKAQIADIGGTHLDFTASLER